MKLKIDADKLEAIIKRKFGSYIEVERASKVNGKARITVRTLYNLMNNQGWRSDTINTLCEILDIHPSEIVRFENGEPPNTHAFTRSTKVESKQGLVPVV